MDQHQEPAPEVKAPPQKPAQPPQEPPQVPAQPPAQAPAQGTEACHVSHNKIAARGVPAQVPEHIAINDDIYVPDIRVQQMADDRNIGRRDPAAPRGYVKAPGAPAGAPPQDDAFAGILHWLPAAAPAKGGRKGKGGFFETPRGRGPGGKGPGGKGPGGKGPGGKGARR